MDISYQIDRLISYGLGKNLITKWDVIQVRNELMDLLNIDQPSSFNNIDDNEDLDNPNIILNEILNYCAENDIIKENTVTYRDLMDTKIMGLLIDRESNIIERFYNYYSETPKKATDYFYKLCRDSNYIRTDRVSKNIEWNTNTKFGSLKITINMSKPELDAKEVERMKLMPKSDYPKCYLCIENVGFKGRINYPARQNHRVIPLNLNNEQWYLQYSPYVYYNEHCIVFCHEHRPMSVEEGTFGRLFDFVDILPHYFLGSNAGLPIIGGSILSHDHYQGGNETFPIEQAPYKTMFKHSKYKDVKMGIIKWCMGTIKMESENREQLIEICVELLNKWIEYKDEENNIIPSSYENGKKIQHNGITPIVRKKNDKYIAYIVFRNNRTTEQYPDGIFHPHKQLHHIKKEGIGVIEVMGQAILPARLKYELDKIEELLIQPRKNISDLLYEIEDDRNNCLNKHLDWIRKLLVKYNDIDDKKYANEIIKKEIGNAYVNILSDAGVFKYSEEGLNAFNKFIKKVGFKNC